ncbi:hypothetical protein BJF78_30275 [Pseudonocardia sp. CNS-139]|nr:hypothetical protein BJF78_30275 [Pseudonocardia sp. CNS-139]
MELHQLRYAVAVAELGSFTRAAQRLLPSPSRALSVADRQAANGGWAAPLFRRGVRPVEPTAAGAAFLVHARRVLAEVDAARAAVRAAAGAPAALAVGAVPSVAARLMPAVLAALAREHPGVTVTVVERERSAEVVELARRRRVDAAVAGSGPTPPDLRVEAVLPEPLVLLLPPGHPLDGTGSVPLAAAAGERFVALPAAPRCARSGTGRAGSPGSSRGCPSRPRACPACGAWSTPGWASPCCPGWPPAPTRTPCPCTTRRSGGS